VTAPAAGLLAKATGSPLSPEDMKALVQGPSERDIVYSGLEGACCRIRRGGYGIAVWEEAP
jgi:hypothetical protein